MLGFSRENIENIEKENLIAVKNVDVVGFCDLQYATMTFCRDTERIGSVETEKELRTYNGRGRERFLDGYAQRFQWSDGNSLARYDETNVRASVAGSGDSLTVGIFKEVERSLFD